MNGRGRWTLAAVGTLGLLALLVVAPVAAHATTGDDDSASGAANELTAAKAAVLGLVEGVTEYLPISSTGHLHVTQRVLDVGTTPETENAADTYAIVIQAGAILAVVLVEWHRIKAMARGLVGRDESGRQLLIATAIAFVPAAVVGATFERVIKDRLFGAGPIVSAWIVGGVLILVAAGPLRRRAQHGTVLAVITRRQALLIGLAQVLALWPGTSRSMVTILAAMAVGLGAVASVEFSFILGFLTLTAATAFEALQNGGELVDTFGIVDPLIGFVVAFVAAVVAVRWLLRYLERHSLAIFGWYRLGIAVITIALLASRAI